MTNPIQRALISVSNKADLLPLAHVLADAGIEILSTGGTATLLSNNGIPVTNVSDYTGFPEMMDGRVKTLHPKIHGGLLAREQDRDLLKTHDIGMIDLVIVNLYPFKQTIEKPNCTFEQAIEHIDIGGPCMLRSAAKNHARVTVVVDPDDYSMVIDRVKNHQGIIELDRRKKLAQKAFAHTASYDTAIATYLNPDSAWPEQLSTGEQCREVLRYGENPHQRASFYQDLQAPIGSLGNYKQHQGKAISYNNLLDADTAWRCVSQFDAPACVIVKHANPCGVAVADNQVNAYQKALATDAQSAFGGIIAVNQPLEADLCKAILHNKQFVEVIIAPEIKPDALTILSPKKNIRVLSCGAIAPSIVTKEIKTVSGGLLIQEQDIPLFEPDQLKAVTKRQPTESEMRDLHFAWQVAKFVKSNAIVYAKACQTLGVGAGQMSRVDSARIALWKAEAAKLPIKGAVMASDAFFPFRDSIDSAAKAGIVAIIQPGGSIRDKEIIQAADEAGIAMVLTGMRHFRH